jgi:hypothetical protein
MSLFEFLMVLVSIIVGLGIAEIQTGVARRFAFVPLALRIGFTPAELL